MNRFEGKSVFVTGAARGQGRSHAVHFAREGADVAVSDICSDIGGLPYELSNEADLAETVRLCEAEGATAISGRVDVRDYGQVDAFARRTLEEFGKIDVLVANAGIFGHSKMIEMSPETFGDMIDVNLKGVWHTIRAVAPSMVERQYGRIVATGSVCSLIGLPMVTHYIAAKHGVAGLVKSLAHELGPEGVTINLLVPNGVGTRMILNQPTYELMNPDDPTLEAAKPGMAMGNAIPLPWIEPEDVSRMVLFMASDDARYTTGSAFKIDLGRTG